MAEDYKVQLSLKKGDGMLNIRAENAAEFRALYEELGDLPFLAPYLGTKAKAPAKTKVPEEAAPAEEPTSEAPLSALEIARQRMKGAK